MVRSNRETRIKAVAVIAFLALCCAPSGIARDAKPRETKGISLESSSTLGLGAQIPALKGYALQIRVIVLKPGAVAAYHSHARRPVVAYLVNGDYTEHRDGQGVVVHKPGDQWVEGADVAHWSENRGNESARLINVEVFRTR